MLAGLAAAALLTAIAAGISVALLVMQVRRTLETAAAQLTVLTAKTAGELDEVHRLTLEAALTAREARLASAAERAALPQVTAQTERALRDLDGWMVAMQGETASIDASQRQIATAAVTTLNGVAPVLADAGRSLTTLDAVATDMDRQVSNPAIAASLAHVDAGTAALAASAQDVQGEVHALTHPGWMRRVWNGVLDVAHVFNPL